MAYQIGNNTPFVVGVRSDVDRVFEEASYLPGYSSDGETNPPPRLSGDDLK